MNVRDYELDTTTGLGC